MSDMRSHLTAEIDRGADAQRRRTILDLATGTGRVARPLSKAIANRPHRRRRRSDGDARCRPSSQRSHRALRIERRRSGQAAVQVGTFRSRFRVVQPAPLRQSRRRRRRSPARAQDQAAVSWCSIRSSKRSKDAIDVALEAKINQVFRRTHGEAFRFHTVSSIDAC